jgi:hypothetical protein
MDRAEKVTLITEFLRWGQSNASADAGKPCVELRERAEVLVGEFLDENPSSPLSVMEADMLSKFYKMVRSEVTPNAFLETAVATAAEMNDYADGLYRSVLVPR